MRGTVKVLVMNPLFDAGRRSVAPSILKRLALGLLCISSVLFTAATGMGGSLSRIMLPNADGKASRPGWYASILRRRPGGAGGAEGTSERSALPTAPASPSGGDDVIVGEVSPE